MSGRFSLETIVADLEHRKRVAYHEAGHAVAEHQIGRRVDFVTIEGTSMGAGYCASSAAGAPPPASPEAVRELLELASGDGPLKLNWAAADGDDRERQIFSALAGTVAERLWSGHDNWAGSRGDREYAIGLILGRSSVEELVPELEAALAMAELLLRAVWPRVERVAEALLQRSSLTGDEVREIIRNAGIHTT